MFRKGEQGAISLILMLLSSITYESATTGSLAFPNWLFLLGIGAHMPPMLIRRYRR